MAVPPTGNTVEEPDTIAFGIAALDSHLDEENISFPTTKESLRDSLGTVGIPYNAAGSTMPLDEAIEQVPKQRFESKRELLNALHPVFEERREAGPTKILDRIRSFIPF